eukprot:8605217-Pyramimonas_sp.AAC.2
MPKLFNRFAHSASPSCSIAGACLRPRGHFGSLLGPLGGFWGWSGWPPGGLLGAAWEPLGGLVRLSRGLLGASWGYLGLLGASWGRVWASAAKGRECQSY